jgi:DNA polymerase-3 subunit chi
MAEIGFYHLTRTDFAATLPPLLGRTLQLGERAVIICPDASRLKSLDAALWTAPHPDWLPHGTPETPHPEWQPIYLTLEDTNPSGANFLFLIAGAAANPAPYKRVFDLFDGNDETQLTAARTRWRDAKAAGHTIAYWKQGENGWEKAG